jgi:hypothetical protein
VSLLTVGSKLGFPATDMVLRLLQHQQAVCLTAKPFLLTLVLRSFAAACVHLQLAQLLLQLLTHCRYSGVLTAIALL